MSIEVFDCEQGSPEWFACRLGIPTASCFDLVQAKGRTKGEDSKTRRKYLRRLAGEIITGRAAETYTNAHMERGKELEPEARELYRFANEVELKQVGFVKDAEKGAGASPDALVADEGGLEIKCCIPDIVIEKIEADKFPSEYWAQCQGGLWVTGREWWDLVIYCPAMPLFVKRAWRDEAYIAELAAAVAQFNEELEQTVERVRNYGTRSFKQDLVRSLEAEDGRLGQ